MIVITHCFPRLLKTAVLSLCLLYPSTPTDNTCPLAVRYFSAYSKDVRQIITTPAFRKAFRYFSDHKQRIKNRKFLAVIDYTRPSHAKRLYLLNRETCEVGKYLVAHGKNSGYSYPTRFSNDVDSHMSSRGFYLTGRTYIGSHGLSLLLHGLEKMVNDNSLKRGIVIHGAEYVNYRSVLVNRGRLGRSFGCPAVPASEAAQIIHKLKDGSLLYIHAKD